VSALAGIVVLVVVAFLVETAAAHREFTLSRLRSRSVNGRVLGIVAKGPLKLSRVWNIRLALEDANLLLVGLLALHARPPELSVSSTRATARDVLVDAASGVYVVLDIAFDRVLAQGILEVLRRDTGHRCALRSADHGIFVQILFSRCVQFGLLVRHASPASAFSGLVMPVV
jgi:hypothetical protein